ncbi:MAG: M28 family peptidase [Chloroflexi bacterium]|nr:M28 family peptidase [Chloroflexota bacterium]
MALLDYVKALEGRDSRSRGLQVVEFLKEMGLTPAVQESRLLSIRNILVDFGPPSTTGRMLFTAHYDAVPHSPGANDNASGVAVLSGLCRELKYHGPPIRAVFFDREEAWLRTPFVHLGLLGSSYYVLRSSLAGLNAVYNLEFCGMGDAIAVWPVRGSGPERWLASRVKAVADKLGLALGSGHIPWPLLSSDHLPFRFKGLGSAVTLSVLPKGQLPAVEELTRRVHLRELVRGLRPALPWPLSLVHTQHDTSDRLSEASLQMMLALLRELARQA